MSKMPETPSTSPTQDRRVKVSIILASYNGAQTLPRSFGALATLNTQGLDVEFILVDNGSTDSTAILMKDFLQSQNGQYILENRAGKSNALNNGLSKAKGDLIVLTDDDVIPAPHWLSALAFASISAPETMAFAGQIRLVWPSPPSKWLIDLESMGRTLGATPRQRRLGAISYSEVKGANCAFRRDALRMVSAFRTDLGVSSQGTILAGEETAFFQQLEEAGHWTLFVPEAELGHIVRPSQMSIWSLIQRGVRNGRGSAARRREPLAPSRFRIFGIPGYAFRNILRVGAPGLLQFWLGDKVAGACELLRSAEMSGYFLESARQKP